MFIFSEYKYYLFKNTNGIKTAKMFSWILLILVAIGKENTFEQEYPYHLNFRIFFNAYLFFFYF